MRVVDENPDIQVVFFECKGTRKLRIEHYADVEPEKGIPTLAFFEGQYNANRDKEYLALQLHPQQIGFNQHFNSDFVPIVEFLKREQVTFITRRTTTNTPGTAARR